MPIKINLLEIRFENPIHAKDISLFRGAIIASLGKNCNILYHNHDVERFRYRYPLIQYKRIQGKAAIICIGEGVNTIGDFLSNNKFDILLGKQKINLQIESIYPKQYVINEWNETFTYHLSDWLPLNQKNYVIYQSADALEDRIHLLEKILTGNILSFCKSFDCMLESSLICKILQITHTDIIYYKQTPMLSVCLDFKTNISLPNHIGLGKGVSLNHGNVFRKK